MITPSSRSEILMEYQSSNKYQSACAPHYDVSVPLFYIGMKEVYVIPTLCRTARAVECFARMCVVLYVDIKFLSCIFFNFYVLEKVRKANYSEKGIKSNLDLKYLCEK